MRTVGNVKIQTQHFITCGGHARKQEKMDKDTWRNVKDTKTKNWDGFKAMLLNILPNNITKIHSKLFKYLVKAAKVFFAAKWKAEKCTDLKKLNNKLNEYATMASYIHNRPAASEFQEK